MFLGYSVAAVPWLESMVHVVLFPMLRVLYFMVHVVLFPMLRVLYFYGTCSVISHVEGIVFLWYMCHFPCWGYCIFMVHVVLFPMLRVLYFYGTCSVISHVEGIVFIWYILCYLPRWRYCIFTSLLPEVPALGWHHKSILYKNSQPPSSSTLTYLANIFNCCKRYYDSLILVFCFVYTVNVLYLLCSLIYFVLAL